MPGFETELLSPLMHYFHLLSIPLRTTTTLQKIVKGCHHSICRDNMIDS